jgi:hypothetical protein
VLLFRLHQDKALVFTHIFSPPLARGQAPGKGRTRIDAANARRS